MQNIQFNNIYLIIGCSLLFLCSCSKPSATGLETIPEGTNIVYAIDWLSLYKKVNIENADQMQMTSAIKKEMRSKDKRLYKLVDDALDAPQLLGVDFREKLFVYYTQAAEDEQYFCASMSLHDSKAFKAFVDRCIEKLDIEASFEEEPTYNYYILDREVGVSWDKEKALIVMANNYESRANLDFAIEDLMTLDQEDGIKQEEDFKNFHANSQDVSVFINSNLWEEDGFFQQLEQEYNLDLRDNKMLAHLNFEKDAIRLSSQLLLNEELAYPVQEYDIWDNQLNKAMLAYLPQESFFLSSLSINPQGYYELLTEEEDMERINAQFKRSTGVPLETVFSNIEGDAIFSISGFEEVEYTYNPYGFRHSSYYYDDYEPPTRTKKESLPMCNFLLKVRDQAIFEGILDYIPGEGLQKRKRYYELQEGETAPIYIAFKDNYLLVSNSKRNISTFIKGGGRNNLQDSPLKDNMLASNFYMNFNLDFEAYPSLIKKEIRKTQSQEEKRVFKAFTDLFEYTTLQQSGSDQVEWVIHLKEHQGNSLNSIVQELDDNYELIKEGLETPSGRRRAYY